MAEHDYKLHHWFCKVYKNRDQIEFKIRLMTPKIWASW